MLNYSVFYWFIIVLGFLSCIGPFLTYFRERGEKAYIYLLILSIVTGPIWSISSVTFLAANTYDIGNLWIKIIYMSSVVIGILHFVFTSNYLQKRKANFLTYLILIVGGVTISYSILFTNSFVKSINLGQGNYANIGIFYYIWIVWLVFIFSGNLLHVLKQYKGLSFIEKEQHKYLIIGTVLTTIGSFPANIILPIWGIYQYIWVGPAIFSISNIIISYGLTQTKFARFSRVVREFLRTISLYIFPSIIVVVLLINSKQLFSGINIENNLLIYSILVLLVASFIKFIEILSNKLFLSEKDILENSVKSFSYGISGKTDLEELSKNALEYITSKTSVSTLKLLIYDDANGQSYEFSRGEWELKNLDKILIEVPRYWQDAREEIRPLVRAELEYIRNRDPLGSRNLMGILQILEIGKIQIIYPIIAGRKIVGLFLIKDLIKKDIFRSSELLLLDQIYSHLHNAINRALLYKQLQTFNQTLQQRVNEQTKELQLKVEQLEEARRKESDMIDIMGHELRTPATIVKLNVDMLEKYIESNPIEFKKYVERIKEAIDNEIKLINTLLSSAKLEGTEIEINKEQVNIKNEIEMALHAYEEEAKKKGIKIENLLDSNTPAIYADKARTVEIVNNLIDNAVKYTERGSVRVKSEFNNDFVTISVIDTGKGIPKEEISRLGQKFHRVNNYLESNKRLDIVRPGGTGLGLYVTFKLVELMGGKISVKSEVNVGSEFVFSLPVYKGEEETNKNDGSKNMFEILGLKH